MNFADKFDSEPAIHITQATILETHAKIRIPTNKWGSSLQLYVK
jgi:hypothetical protein